MNRDLGYPLEPTPTPFGLPYVLLTFLLVLVRIGFFIPFLYFRLSFSLWEDEGPFTILTAPSFRPSHTLTLLIQVVHHFFHFLNFFPLDLKNTNPPPGAM